MGAMDESERRSGDARDPRRGDAPDMQGLAQTLGRPKGRHDARDRRGPQTISGRDSRDVRESTGRDESRDEISGKLEVVEYTGRARPAGQKANAAEATLRLEGAGLTLQVGSGHPIRAGYRDLSLVAIQDQAALIALGEGSETMRFLLEQFGDKLGPMVQELRERRLRQRLTDGLVQVPEEPAELVEFAWKPSTDPLGPGSDGPASAASGVGQLVMQPWGLVVSPLDERLSWIHYRRAAIEKAEISSPGAVRVDGRPGTLDLRGLGAGATRHRDEIEKLRTGAFDDAARFVEQLLPDASFGIRQKAGELLVDGRPVRPAELGDGWPLVEGGVLAEPEFADSYRSLCATAGKDAPRWVSISPQEPGGDEPKIWFLIALPGNLVAMELVSAGAHATYFFRVMPRAQYKGEAPDRLGRAAERCVRDISEALVDCRFLREPMALPAEQLALPRYLRYRLALAVLPSLVTARSRFVARVVHSDPETWQKAVADLIRWHGSARDDAAEWPGRRTQETAIEDAGGEESAGSGEGAADAQEEAKPSGKSKPSGKPG
jgi:hypothetical protein